MEVNPIEPALAPRQRLRDRKKRKSMPIEWSRSVASHDSSAQSIVTIVAETARVSYRSSDSDLFQTRTAGMTHVSESPPQETSTESTSGMVSPDASRRTSEADSTSDAHAFGRSVYLSISPIQNVTGTESVFRKTGRSVTPTKRVITTTPRPGKAGAQIRPLCSTRIPFTTLSISSSGSQSDVGTSVSENVADSPDTSGLVDRSNLGGHNDHGHYAALVTGTTVKTKGKGNRGAVASDNRTVPDASKTSNDTGSSKPHVYREDIRRQLARLQEQYSTDEAFAIPKAAMVRLLLQIMDEQNYSQNFRLDPDAKRVLHQAAELFITSHFEDLNLCSIHVRRQTVTVTDAKLVRELTNRRLDPIPS